MLTDTQRLCYSVINILELLKVESNVLQPNGLIQYEDKTYRDISAKIGKAEERALAKIISIVKSIKPNRQNDVEINANKAGDVIREHGNSIKQPASDIIKKNSKTVYIDVKDKLNNKFGKSVVEKQFGIADELAVDLINDWTHVFIGNHYNDEVSQLVIDEIIDIFRKEPALAVRDIAAKLEESLPGLIRQKGYFDVVAGQVLNLTRSWSNMNFLSEAKIERYQVVAIIDGRTSQICRFMDGREFEVRKTLDKYGRYADADTIDDVKAVSPWATTIGGQLAVSGQLLTPDMTGPELQAMGIDAPPYHGRCRSTVVALF